MKIKCDVCMHHCELNTGQRGLCKARYNRGDGIYPANYGFLTSLALDPIEKKPLKYFRQGSMIISVGSFGCNLRCPYCQNSSISQAYGDRDHLTEYAAPLETRIAPGMENGSRGNADRQEFAETSYYSPEDLKYIAVRAKRDGNIGVAYTYNEPMIAYEYIKDTGELIREEGMVNVIVTNGQAEIPVLERILPVTDAMNIDLKGFSDECYKALGGSFELAKDFIKRAAKDCHVELTTLVVPGLTDSPEDMEKEAAWIASIDPDIPLHITRFFPRYKMTDPEPTDIGLMKKLREIAEKKLNRVCLGNV
ncbi:MAG: radical SAM protein [Lachnospiraceae bacterium]|nr:radical SAM protein [Lachnospiraceae bacterium]